MQAFVKSLDPVPRALFSSDGTNFPRNSASRSAKAPSDDLRSLSRLRSCFRISVAILNALRIANRL